ncbi:MAG TPA: Spy/CpxP family protein refolding chaperone [Thermoanaerobaculia bacterium]|nr:Spy/CpxP family protein refolding chaperone [Thermoanaerobaculia bacterium]
MNRFLIVLTASLSLAAIAAAPFVYGDPHRPGRGPGARLGMPPRDGVPGPLAHLQRLRGELGLSDDQVAQISAILRSAREQNAPYREQLRGGRATVFEALLADPNDLAAAEAILDRQASAQRAIRANMIAATSRALNILTADQRETLSRLVAERKTKMPKRRS